MLLSERRLRTLEAAAVDLACATALQRARAVSREAFAQTWLTGLPLGPQPGEVWAEDELTDLSLSELLAVARLRHPLPALDTMQPEAIRRYFAEQEPA